jgi:tetratricopeptide (TPR) repeat protein
MKSNRYWILMALVAIAMIMPQYLFAQDIPYTTSSDEARTCFMRGLDNIEYFILPQAKDDFQKAVKADPQFAMAYYYLNTLSSTAAEAQEMLDKAMAHIDAITEAEKLVILSAKATSDNNTEAAVANLQQLTTLLPNGKRAHYLLGNYLYGLQRWPESEKAYLKAIEIDPAYAPPYNNLAYIYSNNGKYNDAIKMLQKYADARPSDANPHDSMGEIYLWMGDNANSIKGYSKALSLDPQYAPSYAGLGHNYTFMGNYEKAREEYNLIRTHARNLADSNTAFFWVTVSYLHEGKPAEAAASLLKQLDFCRTHKNIQLEAAIHGQLGRVYIQSGDFEKALKEVAQERESAMNPEFQPGARAVTIMDGLFTESMIWAKQGKKEQSDAKAAEFKKWAEETGNPVAVKNIHTLAGIDAYWGKDYKTAIKELSESNPLNQEAKYYLGLSNLALGNIAEAKRIFSEIVKFNQNSIIYGFYRRAANEKLQS